MTPRGRSALQWGVVGALSFLVFHQGYLLVGGEFLGFGPVGSVAAAVFALATVATYVMESRLGPAGGAPAGGSGESAGDDSGDRPPDDRIREERLKAKERLDERFRDGSE